MMLLQVALFAQPSSLIFFTENGEKFILFVDGDQKNDTPMSRVTAPGIQADFAQVKIQFEHPGAPLLKQQMMIDAGMQMTTVIRRNKKGRYILRPVSSVPAPNDPEPATVRIEETVTHESTEKAPNTTLSMTAHDTQSAPVDSEQVSVDMSVSDGQDNMNMQVSVTLTGNLEESSTVIQDESPAVTPREPAAQECPPMNVADYGRAKKSITNKSFADEKMTIVKQVLRANCLSVDQVIGFMELFSFEENKLEVAKAAYPKTTDQGNYYQVNDALTYSESVEELNRFLESQ